MVGFGAIQVLIQYKERRLFDMLHMSNDFIGDNQLSDMEGSGHPGSGIYLVD
jgi:hypothetical protein